MSYDGVRAAIQTEASREPMSYLLMTLRSGKQHVDDGTLSHRSANSLADCGRHTAQTAKRG